MLLDATVYLEKETIGVGRSQECVLTESKDKGGATTMPTMNGDQRTEVTRICCTMVSVAYISKGQIQ